jgi:hypothetical protein
MSESASDWVWALQLVWATAMVKEWELDSDLGSEKVPAQEQQLQLCRMRLSAKHPDQSSSLKLSRLPHQVSHRAEASSHWQ